MVRASACTRLGSVKCHSPEALNMTVPFLSLKSYLKKELLKLMFNFWVALYNVFVELAFKLLLFILTVLFRLFVLFLNYLTDSAFIKYWCC